MSQNSVAGRSMRLLLALCISGLVSDLAGQAATTTPTVLTIRETTCNSCAIRTKIIARVGKDSRVQDAAPNGFMAAIPDGDSLLIALPAAQASAGPVVLNITGTRARHLGAAGSGPGEYRAATQIARWRKDSILVLDQLNSRISVLDPQLKFSRALQVSALGIEVIIALSSGDIVGNAALNDPKSLGYPLHLYSPNGELRRSFGVDTPVVRPDRPLQHLRFLASDGVRVWSVPLFGRYEIEEWDPRTGRAVRTIRRVTRDYPPATQLQAKSPTSPPQPASVGLFYDQGVIWSLFVVPDRRWKKALSRKPVPTEGGGQSYPVTDKNMFFDTVVEAFDARTGQLLATTRLDEYMIVYFSQGKLATALKELGDGTVTTEFITFALAR